MRKTILTALFAAAISIPASASTFYVSTDFVNQAGDGIDASTFSGIGDSSIMFSNTAFNETLCSDNALCNTGAAGVTISSATFSSGGPTTFTWDAGSLVYTTSSAWTVQAGGIPNNYAIYTTGTWSSNVAGYDPTPGSLSFTWVGNATTGLLSFQASGIANPVPEPATMALVGLGLAAIGLYKRRRKA